MKYYKFLTAKNKGPYSDFDYTPYTPKNGKPGKWLPNINNLAECASGYHACTIGDAIKWLEAICVEVEYKEPPIKDGNKVLGNQMRIVRVVESWNDKSARLFACDCAEHILHIFEEVKPNDNRPRKAIETARLFVAGKATRKELVAAGDAARAAARDAAWAAAGAAWAAAWDAEQSHQTQLLQKILVSIHAPARGATSITEAKDKIQERILNGEDNPTPSGQ